MLLIPDEFLESSICDFCSKFLTVDPIRIYPDEKRRCGRCYQGDTDWVFCEKGLFAEQGLFKCINRFDGCRRLMTFTEVAQHELTCESYSYDCPECPSTCNLPTYMMIQHYEKEHPDLLLITTSTFKIDTTHEAFKVYIRKVKDNLFFVEYNKQEQDNFTLNTFFLGKVTRRCGLKYMTQKFTLSNNNFLETTETTSEMVNRASTTKALEFQGFRIDDPLFQRKMDVSVTVHLDLDNLEIFLAKQGLGLNSPMKEWKSFAGVKILDNY